MYRILLVLVLCLYEFKAVGQTPTARQIFDRMVNAYTNARTYQDKAVVKNVFYKPDGVTEIRVQERVGTIAFDRTTKRFRFEYREINPSVFDMPNRYLIWSNGRQVKTWWTYYDSVDTRPSLVEALGAATGVSGGLSHDIPGLLFGDSVDIGWSIGHMTQLRYAGQDTLNKRVCHQILGLNRLGKPMLLWIDQQSFLLIGIDEGENILPNKVEVLTTMRFDPIVNQTIPEQNFAFDIPRYFWLWFWPTVGMCAKAIAPTLVILGVSRIIRWFRNRPATA